MNESKYFNAYCNREEKTEEPETPKYRDRAKERREDQNPDYEPTELGFHAVAPPGTVDIRLDLLNAILFCDLIVKYLLRAFLCSFF